MSAASTMMTEDLVRLQASSRTPQFHIRSLYCTFIVIFGVSYCNCGSVAERESVVFYICFSSAFVFILFLLFVVCLLFCFDISTRQLCFFICLFSLTFVCQRCFFCLHRIFWFSIFVIPPLHFINYALFLSVHQRKWRENSNECYQITHCSLWLVWERLVFIFCILFYILKLVFTLL